MNVAAFQFTTPLDQCDSVSINPTPRVGIAPSHIKLLTSLTTLYDRFIAVLAPPNRIFLFSIEEKEAKSLGSIQLSHDASSIRFHSHGHLVACGVSCVSNLDFRYQSPKTHVGFCVDQKIGIIPVLYDFKNLATTVTED